MKLKREEFLTRLLCVQPGVSKQETIRQSSCVVMRAGRLYSLSQEVACSVVSGLPEEIDATVQAERLLGLFKSLPDEEVEVTFDEQTMTVKGSRPKARLALEADSVLPIDAVERPKKADWKTLEPNFTEACDLAVKCTNKAKEAKFLEQVVHLTPDFVEGSDSARFLRYPVKTFVGRSVLVRNSTLASILQLGMTKGCETANWLHFFNPLGLRLSVRKFQEDYPDLGGFLLKRGSKVTLPKDMADILKRAADFSDGRVKVKLSRSKVEVEAACQGGDIHDHGDLCFDGPEVRFSVQPKLLEEAVAHGGQVEVADGMVRVDGPNYVFCVALEAV